jgi:hypothetical protein
MKIALLVVVTQLRVAVAGFASGIYLLPTLTAVQLPFAATIASASGSTLYSGFFTPDSIADDFPHWNDGTLPANIDIDDFNTVRNTVRSGAGFSRS